ncbi:hypothetical protein BH10ACI3_BH10ACI3_10120 [soil metagenome]
MKKLGLIFACAALAVLAVSVAWSQSGDTFTVNGTIGETVAGTTSTGGTFSE